MTSSKDRTGNKLMASIKKSKSGARKTTPTPTKAVEETPKKKSAPPKRPTSEPRPSGASGYSYGNRVWPD